MSIAYIQLLPTVFVRADAFPNLQAFQAAQADLNRVYHSAPGFAADEAENASLVSWGLSRLRRAHAEILEAFYFDGKSVRDIARERSLSERAVEGRLRRARAKLGKIIHRIRPRNAKRVAEAEGGTHRVQP